MRQHSLVPGQKHSYDPRNWYKIRTQALDVSAGELKRLEDQARQHSARLLTVTCDVSDDAAQRRAFSKHVGKWGRLDFALLNAGIGERGIHAEPSPGSALDNSLPCVPSFSGRPEQLNPLMLGS